MLYRPSKSYLIHAVCCIRILSIRIKISPVLNAYVVMTSSLLHKDTENLKKNKRFPTTEPFSDYPYRAYCMYGNENFGKFTRFPFMIRNFHQASLFSNFEVPWDLILGNLQGSLFMIWNFHQASLVFQFWSDMGCDLANSQGSLFMIWNFHQASLVFQFWSDMGSDFWQTHKGPPFWFDIFTKLHFFYPCRLAKITSNVTSKLENKWSLVKILNHKGEPCEFAKIFIPIKVKSWKADCNMQHMWWGCQLPCQFPLSCVLGKSLVGKSLLGVCQAAKVVWAKVFWAKIRRPMLKSSSGAWLHFFAAHARCIFIKSVHGDWSHKKLGQIMVCWGGGITPPTRKCVICCEIRMMWWQPKDDFCGAEITGACYTARIELVRAAFNTTSRFSLIVILYMALWMATKSKKV